MLAGIERPKHMLAMQMIGRGDDDEVHRLVREQLVQITV
jgi:hypothetical protein